MQNALEIRPVVCATCGGEESPALTAPVHRRRFTRGSACFRATGDPSTPFTIARHWAMATGESMDPMQKWTGMPAYTAGCTVVNVGETTAQCDTLPTITAC